MSSQNLEATSESTLLLGHARLNNRSRSSSKERIRVSPETLLIPVVLATTLGNLIPLTTFIELVRQTVCRLANISHGDIASLVSTGPSPSELCDTPEVARSFSTVIAVLAAIRGIISMAQCGILSRISSHYGRKPAFAFVLIAGIAGSFLIPGSQYAPDWLAGWVSIVGVLCQLSSGPLPYAYLVNVYIVDVCIPEDRTAALSKIGGWTALGTCIPLALGGSITTKTGNPLIVFYIAAAMFVFSFVYVVFVLPESFPEEKRNALSRLGPEPSIHSTTRLASFLNIFEPLKILAPTPTLGGNSNWRLSWCALHTLVFISANAYATSAWLVLVTSKYHLTPADTGLFFTIVTSSGMIVLTVVVPPLVGFLRPYYTRTTIHSPLADEGVSNNEVSASDTSDHLDVHLAFVSCVIAGISYLCAAESKTILTLILSGIFIGLDVIHTPAIRSLVAGSVDPLKQGEALAAIEMVNSVGTVLSPIIMGAIFSATIDTVPLLFFYVHMVVVPTSGLLLFLVRDADRYKMSNDAIN